MEIFERISTETWELLIPSDWGDGSPQDNGGFYFEAPDETMGFYVTTWNSSTYDDPSNEAAIDHFSKIELSSLNEMPQSSWNVISNSRSDLGETAFSEFDFFDSSRQYRITTKIIASLPWISRLSFHDYLCEDFDSSTKIIEPILKSFQFHNATSA